MSVNLHQGIKTTVSQQVVMTVQQQQSLKLLQCSSSELEMAIQQMLQDNCLLERASNTPEEVSMESMGDYTAHHHDSEDYSPEIPAMVSLQEYLFEQLGHSGIDAVQKTLITYLIGELDDNGYLSSSLEEIHVALNELLPERVSLSSCEEALSLLQNFDPAGVGARSLSECLLLQLDMQRLAFKVDIEVLNVARFICEKGLEALVKADVEGLKQLAGAELASVKAAHQLIRRLNPKPGSLYSVAEADLIIPDILSRYHQGQWEVYLNPESTPTLRINAEYERLFKLMDKSLMSQEMQAQWQEAKVFLTQLNQRFATLLAVAKCILQEQYAFFQKGWSAIKPLTMKVIAEQLGLHESTISRAVNQTFIATPHGVFELKRFFSSGVATQEGEKASATAIQQRMRQLIAQESKEKPLSDSQLVTLLAQEGVEIARRTVAKYREGMSIPVASLRKAQAVLRDAER